MDVRIGMVILRVTLAAALSAACGGDDDESQNEAPVPVPHGLPCGNGYCVAPEGVTNKLCCKDPISGTCGVTTRRSDDCRDFPKIEPRCPVPSGVDIAYYLGGGGVDVRVYGCCTEDNRCGFDVVGDLSFNSVWANLVGPPQGVEMKSCLPREFLCLAVEPGKVTSEQIQAQTCDGQPIEIGACSWESLPPESLP